MQSVRVPGFEPSTSGLHFANYYPHEPCVQLPLPDGRVLGVGDANGGLCGGMVFAARDYFEAGRTPPSGGSAPAEGSPLFEYLVARLLASFNAPAGVLRYLELMNPLLPDGETPLTDFGPLHGRAFQMICQQWPSIQRDLDAGHPVPLGLIKVKSSDVGDLGKNHQVLAYGYDLDGTDLTIYVYDPNYPDRDDIRLLLSIAQPSSPTSVTYAAPLPETVYCFFRTDYTAPAVAPP